jgi:hypothetical protein
MYHTIGITFYLVLILLRTDFLEKVVVVHLIKFHAYYGTWKVHYHVHKGLTPDPIMNQMNFFYISECCFFKTMLILSCGLYSSLPIGPFSSTSWSKIFYVTFHTLLIPHNLVIVIVFGQEHKLIRFVTEEKIVLQYKFCKSKKHLH